MEQFDLELYKTRTEVIRQTVVQVEKDFAMFGLEVEFTGSADLAYPEMFTQLSAHIGRLLQSDFGKLSALLYQIDLSEKSILEAVAAHPDWSQSDVIAELVIHRELKKVLLRNYFRNQKTSE